MNLYTSFCITREVIDLYHAALQLDTPTARKPLDVTYAEMSDYVLSKLMYVGLKLDFSMSVPSNVVYYPVVEYRKDYGYFSISFMDKYINPKDAMDEALKTAFKMLLDNPN